MRNLLSANITRLWKNRTFWICALVMFVISILFILNAVKQASMMKQEGYVQALDDYYFKLLPHMGLLFAVFNSLFLGTEYSDGTIRNKIVAGHLRSSIFISNYLGCLIANLIFLLTWMIGSLVGLPFLGFWRIGAVGLALYIIIAIFFTAALTAIITLVCMLSMNKAITAVFTILMVLGLLLITSMIFNSLCEKEFFGGIIKTAQGVKKCDVIPNPYYVSGFRRTVYQFIIDFLPTGQQIQMANNKIGNTIVSLLYSVIVIIVTITTGIFAFNKKDLK